MPLEKRTKTWNQNFKDKDTVFNRIYIDYADAEKTKPCRREGKGFS